MASLKQMKMNAELKLGHNFINKLSVISTIKSNSFILCYTYNNALASETGIQLQSVYKIIIEHVFNVQHVI